MKSQRMKEQETKRSKARYQESASLETRFLVMGSLNYDYIYSLDHIVEPGETIASVKLDKACGGKGFNQAAALAKAGARVYLAGLVGADGGQMLETAQEFGVDCRFVQERDNRTGHAIIQVDKNGQNSIVLYGGTNRMWTAEYVDSVLDSFEKGDVLILQNEINGIEDILEKPMPEVFRSC